MELHKFTVRVTKTPSLVGPRVAVGMLRPPSATHFRPLQSPRGGASTLPWEVWTGWIEGGNMRDLCSALEDADAKAGSTHYTITRERS